MSEQPPSAVSPTEPALTADFVPLLTVPAAEGTIRDSSPGIPTIPGYEIERVLGRGGMGIVYLARQVHLKRLVALKMILVGEQARPDERARFQAEAEAEARLSHPNIVQVYEIGEWRAGQGSPPIPFFSLEYVEGGSLAQFLSGTPQPPQEAATLVETLARAIQHAHEQGVVHRDLKPANILLSDEGRGAGGERRQQDPQRPSSLHSPLATRHPPLFPKITDFGLAKQLDADTGQTHSGTILGTPSYMAPEQAWGRIHAVGPLADVYALGAILYECLTGRPPFKGASPLETLEQVRHQEPVPPRQLNLALSRDLETVCLKCLHKEPHRRYSSAQDLADDLKRFLAGEPVHARASGKLERLLRWCRRRPAQAAASVLGAILTVALVLVPLLFYLRESQHGKDLQDETNRAREGRRLAERRLAENYLDHALVWCEQGQVDLGLLWLVRALESVPADSTELDHFLRSSLTAWRREATGLIALLPSEGETTSAAFSSDGKRVVTTSQGGIARVWDAANGQAITPPLRHSASLQTAMISPDSLRIATAGTDGAAQLWDAQRGTRHGPPLQHGKTIWNLRFSPKGDVLATASLDGTARLWDTTTGRALTRPLMHGQAVWVVDFHPDGKSLATGCSDGTIRLWSVPEGRSLGPPLRQPAAVATLAFSPDGKLLASGCDDRQAQLWDAVEGLAVGPPLLHQGGITHVAFSPDGRALITASQDNQARLWSVPSGQLLRRFSGHSNTINHVAFSPDGQTLATGSDDHTLRLWDVPTGQPRGVPLKHARPVRKVEFRRDGRAVLTAGPEPQARLWMLAPGPELGPVLDVRNHVSALEFSPDGSLLATGTHERRAQLWCTTSGQLRGPPLEHDSDVLRLVFSSDSRVLASWSRDHVLNRWSTLTGKRTGEPVRHPVAVQGQAFSTDGRWLATGGGDQVLRLWDVSAGRLTAASAPQSAAIRFLEFSPGGELLASASAGGKLTLWDVPTLRQQDQAEMGVGNGSDLLTLAFHPAGQLLGVGEVRGARLWSTTDGSPGSPLPHGEQVKSLAFSPDGQLLVTGGADGTARLWDVRTRQGRGRPLHHQGAVQTVAISADSRTVLTGSADKTARLWGAQTGRPLGPPLRMRVQVHAVKFSPRGSQFALASGNDPVHLGQVPSPLQGEVEAIRLGIELFTGLELDSEGASRPLEPQDWANRRDRLREILGRPGGTPPL